MILKNNKISKIITNKITPVFLIKYYEILFIGFALIYSFNFPKFFSFVFFVKLYCYSEARYSMKNKDNKYITFMYSVFFKNAIFLNYLFIF